MTPFKPDSRRRPLAHDLVDSLAARIRDGRLAPGTKLPTEAEFMAEFRVSRTVVREALSKLQAAALVETRHGVGTFVGDPADGSTFRIGREQLATLHDVIAMLELRIGIEVEAASLAAQRRLPANLEVMASALASFTEAVEAGRDAVSADFSFHLEIMRSTQNPHFANLMVSLGTMMIPRARLEAAAATDLDEARQNYLRRVNAEHENIFDAVANQDADGARAAMRTHLANSRERRRRAAVLGGDPN